MKVQEEKPFRYPWWNNVRELFIRGRSQQKQIRARYKEKGNSKLLQMGEASQGARESLHAVKNASRAVEVVGEQERNPSTWYQGVEISAMLNPENHRDFPARRWWNERKAVGIFIDQQVGDISDPLLFLIKEQEPFLYGISLVFQATIQGPRSMQVLPTHSFLFVDIPPRGKTPGKIVPSKQTHYWGEINKLWGQKGRDVKNKKTGLLQNYTTNGNVTVKRSSSVVIKLRIEL